MQTAKAPAADLRDRIVRGAIEGDLVQLHGAVVAVLEVHQLNDADSIFAAAMGDLASHPSAAIVAEDAIRQQIALYTA
jgi:hypothetical protein